MSWSENMNVAPERTDYSDLIGVKSAVRVADIPASSAHARAFCATLQDRNPRYWDREFYERETAGDTMPPALISTIAWRLPWTPSTGAAGTGFVALTIPLPGTTVMNVNSEYELFEPLREGDILHSIDEVVEISETKTTRLGRGNFVKTLTTYTNQNDVLIATNINTVFRYSAI